MMKGWPTACCLSFIISPVLVKLHECYTLPETQELPLLFSFAPFSAADIPARKITTVCICQGFVTAVSPNHECTSG